MTYPISACVFIRNNSAGFCLFESMASLLPFVSEFVVMDLGSDDGTLEILDDIARHNGKVRLLVRSKGFPKTDAGVFADLANELIDKCQEDNVLYYQADEVWHEDLLGRMAGYFEQGKFDLSFWRIQYRDNWQKVKWFPHLVHRVGRKDGTFTFIGDGMTSDRTWDAEICSQYDGSWFMKWGKFHQEGIKPYVNDMIMDVSMVGGFRDTIPMRRALHAPFWHETPDIEGTPADQWLKREKRNPDWTKTESPYNLPAIMRWHVGRTRYELRPELLEAIKENKTEVFLRCA